MFFCNRNLLALVILVLVAACGKAEKKDPLPAVIQSSMLPPGWYPTDKNQLVQEINDYIALAQKNFATSIAPNSIKALIVPHAGYYYSGLCAATAYQTLLPSSTKSSKNTFYDRVVLIAPSHTMFFNGIALPDYTVYRTTLGDIPVDTNIIAKLKKHDLFKGPIDAHFKEHAIEVQLPFLQQTIANFELIPLIVGHLRDDNPIEIAKEIKKVINDRTLIVISSDFVHHGKSYEYEPFTKNIIDLIRYIDSLAVQAISLQSYDAFDTLLNQTNATICGREAIKILVAMCELNALGSVDAHLCSYYTSAHLNRARHDDIKNMQINKLLEPVPDAQGHESVSYVGLVFAQRNQLPKLNQLLTGYEKKSLLTCARNVIAQEFVPADEKLPPHLLYPVISTNLEFPVGAFVTLNKKGQLRGCIGNIVSQEPLYKTVVAMARAAAFNDNRFSPVTQEEVNQLDIDITILSQPKRINSYKDIVLGKHGIVLEKFNGVGTVTHSSVFLPQVPLGQGWDIKTTLEQLSLKAGLARDSWQENCWFEVFEGFEITWNS